MVRRMPRPNSLGFVVVLPFACQEINIQLPTNRKNGNTSLFSSPSSIHQQRSKPHVISMTFTLLSFCLVIIKEEEKRLPAASYTADPDPVDPQSPNQIPIVCPSTDKRRRGLFLYTRTSFCIASLPQCPVCVSWRRKRSMSATEENVVMLSYREKVSVATMKKSYFYAYREAHRCTMR